MAFVLLLALSARAAWAGAGWYLLTPPVYGEGERLEVDRSAPLQHWDQVLAFASAAGCEAARIKILDAATKALEPGGEIDKLRATMSGPGATDADRAIFALRIYKRFAEREGRCIASDDPRLR
jgi:hypothetical protein